jgi:hypothetical protein
MNRNEQGQTVVHPGIIELSDTDVEKVAGGVVKNPLTYLPDGGGLAAAVWYTLKGMVR